MFAFGVAYIAYRGVGGTTGVNAVINVIQIGALVVFSVIAIGYRSQHPQDSNGWHLSNGALRRREVPGFDRLQQPLRRRPKIARTQTPAVC